MYNRVTYPEAFYQSLSALTGISIQRIKDYAESNSPFNILEHPMVIDPDGQQLEKINQLNDFIALYGVLKMQEEQNRIKLNSSDESGKYFVSLMRGMKDRERVMVAYLDNSNGIIETKIVSEGTCNMSAVYPREVLRIAMTNDCTGIILAHNHPSGTTKPSREDKAITQRIVDIFHPLNIRVLDHIIVGGSNFFSMAEAGYLPSVSLNQARYDPIFFKRDEERVLEESEFEL